MENLYLSNWLSRSNTLESKLSQEDKEILNRINPKEYITHKHMETVVTDEIVLKIIDKNRPQAHIWIERFPELSNLSPEEYKILDGIYEPDFHEYSTIDDVKLLIKKKKEEAEAKIKAEELDRKRKYFEDNKDKIVAEEAVRDKLTRIDTASIILGSAFTSSGIVLAASSFEKASLLTGSIGIMSLAIPLWTTSSKLNKLNSNSVMPKFSGDKPKLSLGLASFILIYFIGILGFGISLGSILTCIIAGSDVAISQFLIGICTLSGSLPLFFLLSATIHD